MADIDNRVIQEDSPKRFIETLQRQLIRENPSALPNYGVDGELGPETTLWVERFQERKGLEVDGVAGPETLGRLRADIIYRRGDTGKGVELLQEDLMYFTVKLAYGASGEYGTGTEQGVKDFQYFNLMKVDGVAGPATFKKIDELYEQIIVQSGDEGALVRRIQKQLNEQESVAISITVDGGYGPSTISAVKKFQKANKQREDGIAGPVTMNLLDLDAYHPSTAEDITNFLNQNGVEFDSTLESQTRANQFGADLASNSAFKNNLPSGAGSLEDLELSRTTISNSNGTGEMYRLSGSMTHPSWKIYMIAAYDSNEALNSFGFVIIKGDLYESPARKILYDVDGELIEDVEDTILEFTNAELDIQMGITEAIEEASQGFQLQSIDFFSCDALLSIGAGLICGVPGLLVGTFTAGVAALVAGSVCGYVTNEIFAPALC